MILWEHSIGVLNRGAFFCLEEKIYDYLNSLLDELYDVPHFVLHVPTFQTEDLTIS